MNSVEQQDAQRIALVATNATVLYARLLAGAILAGEWPEGINEKIAKRRCVKDAMTIINFAEQAVRTPTGDA